MLTLMRLTKAWEARWDKRAILRSYEEALRGADVIVASALSLTPCLCVAEATGAALVALIPGPTWPTAEFPLWALPVPCPCLNRWSYNVAFSALWRDEKATVEAWRAELGLPPLGPGGPMTFFAADETPIIVAASALACGPRGQAPGDWPDHVHLSGFLLAPPTSPLMSPPRTSRGAYTPRATSSGAAPAPAPAPPGLAPGLQAFVTSPDPRPIVYLGFGSMPAPQPVEVLRLAQSACEAAKCRAVVVAGWTALRDDPECTRLLAADARSTLFVVPHAPHGWLFPRCSALVHHCGVGTMAAALASGVPQVPCTFMLDQPHNARLCQRLGVAPQILTFDSHLAAPKLARALAAVLEEPTDGPVHTAAARVAARIREESAGAAELCATVVESAHPAGKRRLPLGNGTML
mmetsp:Transcript_26921/g.72585  ORF Transcript_26921/g.72585 Transcript_26921/m.72585 type:complete len:407 (+) Transcript_26921:332-1552(+)